MGSSSLNTRHCDKIVSVTTEGIERSLQDPTDKTDIGLGLSYHQLGGTLDPPRPQDTLLADR